MPSLTLVRRSFTLSLLVDPSSLMSGIGDQYRIPLGDKLELARRALGRVLLALDLSLFALKQLLENLSACLILRGLCLSHAITDLHELLVNILEACADGVGDGLGNLLLDETSSKRLQGLVQQVMLGL